MSYMYSTNCKWLENHRHKILRTRAFAISLSTLSLLLLREMPAGTARRLQKKKASKCRVIISIIISTQSLLHLLRREKRASERTESRVLVGLLYSKFSLTQERETARESKENAPESEIGE